MSGNAAELLGGC